MHSVKQLVCVGVVMA